MLDPNDDTPTYDAAMTAVTTKIAAQEAMLSGLDPIDHDRAEVRRFRDRAGTVVSSSVDDAARG